MKGIIDSYIELIDEFLSNEIDGDEFQTKYFNLFKSETRQMGEPEFSIIYWLFAEVDAYVPDPELRREVDGLDDDELADRAKQAKSQLLDLML